MATLNYSEFQKEIFNNVKNERTNLCVSAVAGSGKTFTIVNAARMCPKDKSILFVAFNKTIATELGEKLSHCDNVKCSTLHAHGLSALRQFKVQIDKYASYNFKEACLIQSEILSIDSEKQLTYSFKSNCSKLYDLARINLIESGDIESLENLCDMHNIETIADEISVVSKMLKDAYKFHKKIDFVDMLILPIQEDMKRFIPKYDIVFIDECQDLSKAQRELVLSSLKPNGKFVAVGDRKQAINGFAGASCDSFDLLANLPNTKELPLSVNYRCGSNIVNLAHEIVPQIEAHEGAIEGIVNNVDNMKGLKVGDMILCRCSAPLVSLCLKLLANDIKAYVKGKDIAEGLNNLIKRLKAKTLSSLFKKLDKEKEKVAKEIMAKNNKVTSDDVNEQPKMVAFLDKIAAIEAIAESVTSVKQLTDKIEAIFSDMNDKNAVALSTIHKAKGLEADNVWIVVPNKLPLQFKNQKDWQYEQEMNLKYVAITRAKKVLNFVNLDESQLKKVEF